MAKKFQKKKSKPKDDPLLDAIANDPEIKNIWDMATWKSYDELIVLLHAIPLMVAKRELGWNDEELNWFAVKIEEEYNNNIANNRKNIADYAKWVEKNVGIHFESSWIE